MHKTVYLPTFCSVVAAGSAAPAAEFVLASRTNSTIVRYDLATGAYLGQIGPGAPLLNPVDVEVRANGNLLISNFGNGADVLEYTPGGTLVRNLDSNRIEETTAVRERDGHIYALSNDTRRVGVFDSVTGNFLYDFAQDQGFAINFPADMEFGPNNSGDLFISIEGFANRIQVWNPLNGTYLRSFGSEIQFAEGITFGPDNLLYVSDFGANNIKRFDPATGEYLGIFTTVDGPADLGFGPDGKLYVSIFGQNMNNVVRFDGTTGAPLGEFVPAFGATIGPAGFAFVGQVPEPTSLAALAGTGLLLLRRRR